MIDKSLQLIDKLHEVIDIFREPIDIRDQLIDIRKIVGSEYASNWKEAAKRREIGVLLDQNQQNRQKMAMRPSTEQPI